MSLKNKKNPMKYLIFKTFFKQGAKVHRLVKAPGGYFNNKEIEQVEISSMKPF